MPVFQLTNQIIFPPPELAEANGLLAIGGDLSPDRLITAYRQGIFPWYSDDEPILWWFTSPRLVLFPEEFHVSTRLRRYHRNTSITCTINKDFESVITACANYRTKDREETWITQEMINAYMELNRLGYAHSVECWDNNSLVGGLYGIALDKFFFGESMFSKTTNSSKFALIHLVDFLKKNDFHVIDCQMTTQHLTSLGAREVSGKRFQHLAKKYIQSITPNKIWSHGTIN